MPLKSIIIEVRKNLHCANVFLEFENSLNDAEFVKINIDNDSIILREYSTETTIDLQEHFSTQTQSLSSLVIEEKNYSFRLTINPASSLWPENDDVNQKITKQLPHVSPLEEVTLSCSKCENVISKDNVIFERILEFPSGTIDVSEFFCHHGPNLNAALVPKISDMFYGFFYVILNADCLQEIRIKEEQTYCDRCLMHLGETLFEGKAIKIWADTLKEPIFKPKDIESMVSHLMARILDECSVDENLHIMQFSKTILESVMPTRKKKFILLNILERNLDILRNSLKDALSNDLDVVKMHKCKANKVLYQVYSEDKDDDVLKTWREDISVHTIKISPTLFTALLRRLDKNSMLLPEVYRFSDKFISSYFFY